MLSVDWSVAALTFLKGWNTVTAGRLNLRKHFFLSAPFASSFSCEFIYLFNIIYCKNKPVSPTEG